MDDATMLMIEDRAQQVKTQEPDEENFRNRVGQLIEVLRREGIRAEALTETRPWSLLLDNRQPGNHEHLLERCDEIAATLQIELGYSRPDEHG